MMTSYRCLVGEPQVTVYAMVLSLLEHSSRLGVPPPSRRVVARGMNDSAAPDPAPGDETVPTRDEKRGRGHSCTNPPSWGRIVWIYGVSHQAAPENQVIFFGKEEVKGPIPCVGLITN